MPTLHSTGSFLIWLLALLLTAAPCTAPAQTSGPDQSRSIDEVTGKPFIDRKVGSALERF